MIVVPKSNCFHSLPNCVKKSCFLMHIFTVQKEMKGAHVWRKRIITGVSPNYRIRLANSATMSDEIKRLALLDT